jgi:hypothetical protein
MKQFSEKCSKIAVRFISIKEGQEREVLFLLFPISNLKSNHGLPPHISL